MNAPLKIIAASVEIRLCKGHNNSQFTFHVAFEFLVSVLWQ